MSAWAESAVAESDIIDAVNEAASSLEDNITGDIDSKATSTVNSITSVVNGKAADITEAITDKAGDVVEELSDKIDNIPVPLPTAVICVSTQTAAYKGQTIHVDKADGYETYTGTFDADGNAEIRVGYFGKYYLYVEQASKISVTVYNMQEIYHCNLNAQRMYGFRIYGAEADPDSAISYHVQYNGENVVNYNYTPAHVDLATGVMNPGDWNLEDDFFIPRSCMLKNNCEVDYYLCEDDETLRADGVTPSDVANSSYTGNAMMEWGRDGQKIYMKIVPDSTPTNGSVVYIANYKADEGFTDYPFYDANGNSIDHFYTPKYCGSLISGKLRSISGQAPCNTQTGPNEVSYATANNVNGSTEWFTEVLADRQLINYLLFMIGKSTNTQAVFGEGYTTGGSAAASLASSGTLNGKGQWFGSSVNNDKTKGVKVFGMEHWWGNIWRRTAGYLLVGGTQKVKLTWSKVDGSTQVGYDATGSGYHTISNSTPGGTSGGYANVAIHDSKGLFPKTASGSDSTYYCDGLWFNNSNTMYAIVGGGCSNGALCGALCVALDYAFSRSGWDYGAALSCKPLAA